MPKIAAVRLSDTVAKKVMLGVSNLMRGRRTWFVAGPPHVTADEPEMELFMDWDSLRADGQGTYASDAQECRSRRVDLRGPTDEDPGPLPMEEAPEDITAKHLFLS